MVAKQDNTLTLSELTAVTPLDGRYRQHTKNLANLTSEYALIKSRIEIELKYLIALSEAGVTRTLTSEEKKKLLDLSENASIELAQKVKKLEDQTRHDVKAMERALRDVFANSSLQNVIEMIHIGLTSDDINNLSYRLMLKRATQNVLIPEIEKILAWLVDSAKQNKSLPMLARTHGQPAVPTTLGKELAVFAHRLFKQLSELKSKNLTGKLNGAVGNFNALQLVHPNINWISFSEKFITSLGLEPNLITTQINPYDDVASYCQNIHRVNSILIDLNQDMWRYISDNWFVQAVKKGEVGSSTMPQKVNPINFENSEGNLGMANALLEHFARKLPISRLQRDLSDSTTIRNIGTILAYCVVGYDNTLQGLSRVKVNKEKVAEDLGKDWSILGEAVQTLLRKAGTEDPYSRVLTLTRGEHIDEAMWKRWIAELDIPSSVKNTLKSLTPQTYVGLAEKITELTIKRIESNSPAPKDL